MIKNLAKHGNSWALVIDHPILDLLKMNPDAPLEITTDGQSMTIAPAGAGARKAEQYVRPVKRSTPATPRPLKSWRSK